MPDLTQLIGHWGYSAIFFIVILGSIGIPVPEEAIMFLAGLLVWKKKLELSVVLIVGFLSTVIGDNLGYWAGRTYGRATIERYGQKLFISSERLDVMQNFVNRHGQVAVFLARFIPGLRFLAGPMTGIAGMPFPRFFLANICWRRGLCSLDCRIRLRLRLRFWRVYSLARGLPDKSRTHRSRCNHDDCSDFFRLESS